MALYLYVDRDSGFHRLHPVAKLSGMLAFFVAAFVSERPALLLPLATVVALLLVRSGSLVNVRRLRVLFATVFFMTFLVWTLFSARGQPWVELGPVQIGPQSVWFALGMAIKLTTFLAVGTLFLSTTKVEEFAYALRRLGVPYKLGFTMTLAFRLVPAFVESGFTVVQAQRCRGFNFDEGSLLQRLRRYVPVIVPVFIGALRRADNMAMALEGRGFQLRTQRTFYLRYPFRGGDAAAIAVVAAVAGAYLWMWWHGWTHL